MATPLAVHFRLGAGFGPTVNFARGLRLNRLVLIAVATGLCMFSGELKAITNIEAIGVVTSKAAPATLRVDCPIGS